MLTGKLIQPEATCFTEQYDKSWNIALRSPHPCQILRQGLTVQPRLAKPSLYVQAAFRLVAILLPQPTEP